MSITEVAKAAGVSTATVSRVLNELPGVRDDTIQRVRTAVAALNYHPRRSRRGRPGEPGFVKRETGNIAVLALGETRDWLQLPVMASVVAGIQRAAGDFGYRLILDEVPNPDRPISLLQGRQCDGAIVFLTGKLPVSSYAPILSELRGRTPTVWVMGMEMTVGGVDHVTPDNIGTGYIACSYLHDKKCERLAYLTENPEWAFLRLRGQAFLNAAFDSGNPATSYIVTTNPLIAESFGKHVVSAPTLDELVSIIAKSKVRPDGIFAANDATTSRLYPLLLKNKIRPGRDVTIVSCDNEEIRLSAMVPRPASIDIGVEEIGFRAVVRLRARMERPTGLPLVIQVAPRLVLPAA
ncbi:MAG TPA: LacI family DNA-binding transcriptional regulator [Phycisphaerae bacterium]|nr:LacI family DNA-binding transcriptional regulator [Phycisphaerae bacterium]